MSPKPDPNIEPVVDLAPYAEDGSDLPPEIVEQANHAFRVHGCLLIENAFPLDLVGAIRDEFHERYEKLPADEIENHCLRVGHQRYKFTVNIEPPFNDPRLYASPKLLPILRQILGPDCVIHSFGAVCAFPGSDMQHFHKDHGPLYAEAGGLNGFLPPFCLRVHLPMTDLDEATGTTALWPGSHRDSTNRETQQLGKSVGDGVAGAFMPYPKMGDCYLMDFRISHRGTPNVSDRARTVLYMLFSRRWFKDHKNFDRQSRLEISPAEYAKIPEEHRDLFLNATLGNH